MRRRQRRVVLSAVTFLGCFVAWLAIGGFYGCSVLMNGHNPFKFVTPTPDGLEESHRRGEVIVAAIEAYMKHNGTYPARLEELQPAYIVELQQPTVGSCRWEYQVDPQKGFALGYFIGPMYEREWYEGIPGEWKVDM